MLKTPSIIAALRSNHGAALAPMLEEGDSMAIDLSIWDVEGERLLNDWLASRGLTTTAEADEDSLPGYAIVEIVAI